MEIEGIEPRRISLYVSCRNHGLDPFEHLDKVPLERVVAIRLSGCADLGTHCLVVRDDRVHERVWELYAETRRRVGPLSTVVIWDQQPPSLEVVHGEVMKARALVLDSERSGG